MEAYASSTAATSAVSAITDDVADSANNTILLVLVRNCWRFVLRRYYCVCYNKKEIKQ